MVDEQLPSITQRLAAIRLRAKRKRSLAQTISFARKFIRTDAEVFFGRTLEPALSAWISLLSQTTLPNHAPIAFPDITNAVNSLEDAIASKKGTMILVRLGYLRLSIFFDLLEERIQQDRLSGLIPSRTGYGNASIALDYYLHALNSGSDPLQRRRLRERKREGGRWRELAGPSAFLLLMYSDMAERFVKDHSKTDNPTLKILARKALEYIPVKLLSGCTCLSTRIDESARRGEFWDNRHIQEIAQAFART